MPAEMIVYLDPPEHGPMRQVANKKFLRERGAGPERGDRTDRRRDRRPRPRPGATSASATSSTPSPAPFPVAVISWVLGVPRADWEHHFRWTNEIIGKDDPEYRRPGREPRADLHAGPR